MFGETAPARYLFVCLRDNGAFNKAPNCLKQLFGLPGEISELLRKTIAKIKFFPEISILGLKRAKSFFEVLWWGVSARSARSA
jgi:hypothetical protein